MQYYRVHHRLSEGMAITTLNLKPPLHQDTCSGRIQVSRTSNLYPDTSGYKWIHCLSDAASTTILSPIHHTGYNVDGYKGYKWMDTTCIPGLHPSVNVTLVSYSESCWQHRGVSVSSAASVDSLCQHHERLTILTNIIQSATPRHFSSSPDLKHTYSTNPPTLNFV